MTSARQLTTDYDRWLAEQIPVIGNDVDRKHAELRADRFRFLRGTYYLWLTRVAERVPEVLEAARVPIVGDLHVENFGTWRDKDQVRRWGVNDLDELAWGSWLLDPLRLAVSARLAPRIALGDKAVSDTVLTAYAGSGPGRAVKLAGKRGAHLRALVPAFPHPSKFYAHLRNGSPLTDVPAPVVAAAQRIAEPGWAPQWYEREAGTGSLGHLRRVGVGDAADGTTHAREAKQLGPGTAVWAADRGPAMPTPDPSLFLRVMGAISGPGAIARVGDWHLRDLAPDVVRIELSGLRKGDSRTLLASMAQATGAIHAVDPKAAEAARQQAGELDPRTFRRYVDAMVDALEADFADYR
ncbi:DUF2252 family protein [Nocardioides ultimimeridianus]